MGIVKYLKKILPEEMVFGYELRKLHKQINKDTTIEEWSKEGCPIPPPDSYKRSEILRYAKEFQANCFIETGTFKGDTTAAMEQHFEKLITVEIDPKLYKLACKRFKNNSKVTVLEGDAGKILPDVLERLIPPDSRCLFWLDGHYSGSVTGKADSNTPILAEIQAIYKKSDNHVIIIDDARLFEGKNDYPTLTELETFARGLFKDLKFSVEHDLIRLTI